MKNISLTISLVCIVLSMSFAACTSVGGEGKEREYSSVSEESDTSSLSEVPVVYNFYVENSGSMKGYFSGKSDLKDIIVELYDRISDADDSERITLNFINTKIDKTQLDKVDFVNSAERKCTASYTKIDDILLMTMDSLKENHVNIIISDFCFTSNNTSIKIAKSGITSLFAQKIERIPDMAIAVFKYECSFNGRYYPGDLSCKHSLPVYIWAFGSGNHIKRLMDLPIEASREELVMQLSESVEPVYHLSSKRMQGKNNTIDVSEWKKSRKSGLYELKFDVNLSSVALRDADITDVDNYSVSADYTIDSIYCKDKDKGIYEYEVSTRHPSPCTVCISYGNKLPEWVEHANFEGNGVPDEGKTLGIKHLIEGVYNAYDNKGKDIFSINLTLK